MEQKMFVSNEVNFNNSPNKEKNMGAGITHQQADW